MAAMLYTQYVLAQRGRNPSLGNLCRFLTESVSRKSSKVTCLDFSITDGSPSRHDLEMTGLSSLLSVLATENQSHDPSATNTSQPQGRVLIVEDPTKEVIELLGSQLDIDPFFFASYIHGPNVTPQIPKPSMVILPSEAARQNFLCLNYHRALEFDDDAATSLRRLSSDGNVPRKVMLLPLMQDTRIGLAQQSCSVLITSTSQGWLGLVLVDASPTLQYQSSEKAMCLRSQLFQGGFEDFLERPSYSKSDIVSAGRISLLEDLVLYWSEKQPPSFNLRNPSLPSIAYYPLKIAAGEWVRYVEVLSLCIKHYEYSTGPHVETTKLIRLDSDLRDLQAWVRRCMQTLQKLQSVIKFVESRATSETDKEMYDMIVKDYKHITAMVKMYGNRLEAMIPLVTSLVQIVDSRESLREAANVRRLTNLALVFIPLSFVTGLFSMNDSVSARGLGLFFSVAAPLCIVVVFIAHLPDIRLTPLSARLRKLRSPHKIEV